ncbi:MAG: DUF2520 domain-containing protein [Ignavibacteria bacterium]|nr:DUF2520 domain-containing protein [Ignavibacteria bacterium]
MTSPQQPLHVSIIGAGRVGTALAVLFHRCGFRVVSVISRRRRHAKRCALLVKCLTFSTRAADISPDTELLVIAVPDEQIRIVARAASVQAKLDFHNVTVFHTSGPLTSDELDPLRRKGALSFSLHPAQSFPKEVPLESQIKSLRGISYGIEGTARAIRFGRRLATKLGGSVVVVPKKEKILYHLACVLASNYPVALLSAVEEVVTPFIRPPRLRHFERLIETSIRNAFQHSPRRALTGPIVRGSRRIIEAHLRALHRHSFLQDVYRALGRYAAWKSCRAGRLTEQQRRAINRILSKRR